MRMHVPLLPRCTPARSARAAHRRVGGARGASVTRACTHPLPPCPPTNAGETRKLPVRGLFYGIGHTPNSGVLGGQVEMMFDAVPTMQQNIAAGKLKALGTTGRARSAVLPDVPTVAEAGVPGYEATIWLGFMAPTGTPQAVLAKLNAEIGRVVSRADVKAEWAKQGAAPMVMTIPEFTQYLREDIEKWARIVRISGAKADQ